MSSCFFLSPRCYAESIDDCTIKPARARVTLSLRCSTHPTDFKGHLSSPSPKAFDYILSLAYIRRVTIGSRDVALGKRGFLSSLMTGVQSLRSWCTDRYDSHTLSSGVRVDCGRQWQVKHCHTVSVPDLKYLNLSLEVVAHPFNPSNREKEAGRSW